jgi:hypothetical protein
LRFADDELRLRHPPPAELDRVLRLVIVDLSIGGARSVSSFSGRWCTALGGFFVLSMCGVRLVHLFRLASAAYCLATSTEVESKMFRHWQLWTFLLHET